MNCFLVGCDDLSRRYSLTAETLPRQVLRHTSADARRCGTASRSRHDDFAREVARNCHATKAPRMSPVSPQGKRGVQQVHLQSKLDHRQ